MYIERGNAKVHNVSISVHEEMRRRTSTTITKKYTVKESRIIN